VLLAGALVAVGVILSQMEGGFLEVVTLGRSMDKFQWYDLKMNWVTESLVVVILGGVFSNALVPYTSDQTVVQRYLTTADDRAARRATWLAGLMPIPASLLFFFLGTAMFAFYHQNPALLAPLAKADQILPWFMVQQMPAGLAGLVIAGVFAAAMSSLDSSMHSIATTVVTDWIRPLGRPQTSERELRSAQRITLLAGLIGTGTALLLAMFEIKYLWDLFIGMMGLLGGTMAGVFAVGVWLPRVRTTAVWIGIAVSLSVLVFVYLRTPLNGLLYGFIGITVTVLVSGAVSGLSSLARRTPSRP